MARFPEAKLTSLPVLVALLFVFPEAIAPFVPAEPWPPEPLPEAPPVAAPPSDRRYSQLVAEASRRHRVSARLLHAVIQAESSYRAHAVSPAGAIGLMQLMPGTAMRYGVEDLLDPAANIAAGAQHLRSLLTRYEDDVALALAAYNAGEGAVARYGGIPPYPETTRYVARVLDYYEHMR